MGKLSEKIIEILVPVPENLKYLTKEKSKDDNRLDAVENLASHPRIRESQIARYYTDSKDQVPISKELSELFSILPLEAIKVLKKSFATCVLIPFDMGYATREKINKLNIIDNLHKGLEINRNKIPIQERKKEKMKYSAQVEADLMEARREIRANSRYKDSKNKS